MMPSDDTSHDAETMRRVQTALLVACGRLPHLSGIARTIEIVPDDRVPTAAIAATGRMLVNGAWFATLKPEDQVFVVAHELMHLCLRSHDRGVGVDVEIFNIAHDYVINGMLTVDLSQPVPTGALFDPMVSLLSAEEVVVWLREGTLKMPETVSRPRVGIGAALEAAGVLPRAAREAIGPGIGDVIDTHAERSLFPDEPESVRASRRERVRIVTAEAEAIQPMLEDIADVFQGKTSARTHSEGVEASDDVEPPPWEAALQYALEACMPGRRSFARQSRRQSASEDVVLAGRTRSGWAVHVILDTSGSMSDAMKKVLGEIAAFCEAAQVSGVRILQCDTRVTVDEWVSPDELRSYRIRGFGGSDLRPAMKRLRREPAVTAAVVVTDGFIEYLKSPPPYEVLWALTGDYASFFDPTYGIVITAR